MPLATRRPGLSRPTRGVASVTPTHVPADRPKPSLRVRQHVLDVPFEMRGLGQMHGAIWNPVAKAFVYRGDKLPDGLQPFQSAPYSWERLKEDELNGVVDLVPSKPQKVITLKDHQAEAAKVINAAKAAGRAGFLVADDVGLGKTIETWAAVLDMDEVETILIVCPISVIAHWRRTIAWMGDKGRRIVVINYDRLKKLFDVPAEISSGRAKSKRSKRTRKVRTQKGVARFGEAYDFDLVIWDESHKLRNLETARSKLALKLNDPADFVLWLSATAGQNPLELAYLAPLLADVTGDKLSEFAEWEKWCEAQGIGVTRGAFGAWSWRGNAKEEADRIGSDADLEKIRSLLFDGAIPGGIRRSPTDITGWPEINRILLPVLLEPADRALYVQAWNEFREAVGLERRGGSASKNGLVARLRFRQKASLLRTAATADLATELLEQGQQVVISVAFRETMAILQEALEKDGYGVALIHGQMGPAERERNRLDFQHGRKTVCIHTIEDGISLHEAEDELCSTAHRSNIIHDLRWSAIQMKQIEGRTHRDGRFSQVYWMLGAGTVEEDIADVVATRMRSMGIMQGDTATVEAIDGLLADMAEQMRPALLAA